LRRAASFPCVQPRCARSSGRRSSSRAQDGERNLGVEDSPGHEIDPDHAEAREPDPLQKEVSESAEENDDRSQSHAPQKLQPQALVASPIKPIRDRYAKESMRTGVRITSVRRSRRYTGDAEDSSETQLDLKTRGRGADFAAGRDACRMRNVTTWGRPSTDVRIRGRLCEAQSPRFPVQGPRLADLRPKRCITANQPCASGRVRNPTRNVARHGRARARSGREKRATDLNRELGIR